MIRQRCKCAERRITDFRVAGDRFMGLIDRLVVDRLVVDGVADSEVIKSRVVEDRIAVDG
jgi:hypothetical protein